MKNDKHIRNFEDVFQRKILAKHPINSNATLYILKRCWSSLLNFKFCFPTYMELTSPIDVQMTSGEDYLVYDRVYQLNTRIIKRNIENII